MHQVATTCFFWKFESLTHLTENTGSGKLRTDGAQAISGGCFGSMALLVSFLGSCEAFVCSQGFPAKPLAIV